MRDRGGGVGSPGAVDVAVSDPARIIAERLRQSPAPVACAARLVPIVVEQEALVSHSAGGQWEQGPCGAPCQDTASAEDVEWVGLCVPDMACTAVRWIAQ